MKTIDDRIAELGFTKIEENEYRVSYERYDERYKYMQNVDILHKASGKHILQSYDKDSCTSDLHSGTGVGLTYSELRLFTKKMKLLIRKWKR